MAYLRFRGGITLINNHFEGFLDYNNLYQDKNAPSVYWNKKYKMGFFHDFDAYVPLFVQLTSVQKKYQRRIERFYQVIKEPTLIVRYISNEPGTKEADYINDNWDYILSSIKRFHSDNDFLFIANEGIQLNVNTKAYYVKTDKDERVARKFLDKNQELYELFNGVEHGKKDDNKKFYLSKQKSIMKTTSQSVQGKIKKLIHKPYIHDQQI